MIQIGLRSVCTHDGDVLLDLLVRAKAGDQL
jgi:hypothetical protein